MISPVDLALIPISIAALLGVMLLVRRLGPKFGLAPEIQRKAVHIATGLYALTLPFTFESPAAVILLLCVSIAVMLALRLPAFANGGIASAIHAVERKSYGEIYLALAVGIVFWMSGNNLVLFVLPVLVLTLSDAAAALAGTRYGSRHFAVETGSKSWEGVTIFFLVTWILALVILLLMTDIDRTKVVALSVMIAAFGALVEADSWGGLDNLFVPVGVHLLLASHAATPVAQLIALAIGFLLTLYAVIRLSRRIGIAAHSARAYVVLIFLITAVTEPHNAVLAVFAVLAHIAAGRFRPCRSRFPYLDLIAVAAGMSLFWLFIGEFTGRNALNVYNLSFAAMTLIFAGLAAQAAPPPLRIAIVATMAVAVGALLMTIAPLNPYAIAPAAVLWPWMLAALGIAAVATIAGAEFFDRYRSLRAMLVAMPIPLLLFVITGSTT
jgi:dolichol kinase